MPSKIVREPTSREGDTDIYGGKLEDVLDLLNSDIDIRFGKNEKDMNWKGEPAPLGKFIALKLQHVASSNKYIEAFTQCSLAGKQRKTAAVKTLDLLVLDIDNGQPIEELREELLTHGIFAVIYSTYSHLSTTSKVGTAPFMKAMKIDDIEDVDDEMVREYFEFHKHYHPSIIKNMTFDRVEQTAEGAFVFVNHDPQPKYRVVMVLDEPFDMMKEGGGNIQKASKKWKAKYAGVANLLGASYDIACTDPSRLFFRPTHKPNTPYVREIVIGDTIRLADIADGDPRGPRKSNAFLDAAGAVADDEKERVQVETPWLREWYDKHAPSFFAADWARETFEVRQDTGDKVTIACPFDDEHSDSGPHDMGFFVGNPTEASHNRAIFRCSHAGCAHRQSIQFLDKLILDNDISEDDLTSYSEELDEADKEEDTPPFDVAEKPAETKTSKTKEPVKEAAKSDRKTKAKVEPEDNVDDYPEDIQVILRKIGKLRKADADAVTSLFERIYSLNPIESLLKLLLKKIADKTGLDYAGLLRDYGASAKHFAREDAEEDGDEIVVGIKDPFDSQIDSAKKGLAKVNKKNPRLFKLDGIGVARVSKTGDANVRMGDAKREIIDRNGFFKELTDCVRWYDEGPGGSMKTAAAPHDVVNYFLGMEQHAIPLPTLVRLVKHPIFTEDGKLHTKNGYDHNSCAYLDMSFKPLPVPDEITADHLDHCYDLLFDDLFVDFPLRDSPEDREGTAAKANLLAMLLQPFIRDIVAHGNTPLYLIKKPVPGAGSTKIIDLMALILEGEVAKKYQFSPHEEELNKVIIAKLLDSPDGIMFFDNVPQNSVVDSAPLATALTTTRFNGRVLGSSTDFSSPVRHLWAMTGNNVRLSNELQRRTVPITLYPEEVNPELRQDFKHPDLEAWVLENRAELIQALCIIVQNWVDDGMPMWKPPKDKAQVMGSFDRWSLVTGGILQSFGMDGFLENIKGFREEAVTEVDAATELVTRIHDTFKDAPFTVAQLHDDLWDEDHYEIDLPVTQQRGEGSAKRSLGIFMTMIRDRKFEIYMDDKVKKVVYIAMHGRERSGVVRYLLRETTGGKA